MELIKNQITLSINKTEMTQIINEALTDETAGAAIKRAIGPFISESFTQFPDFTNITVGATDENGATEITLKQPRQATPTTTDDVDEADEADESTVTQ